MRFKGHEFYHVHALSHLWCVLYVISLFSLYYTTLDKLSELYFCYFYNYIFKER